MSSVRCYSYGTCVYMFEFEHAPSSACAYANEELYARPRQARAVNARRE